MPSTAMGWAAAITAILRSDGKPAGNAVQAFVFALDEAGSEAKALEYAKAHALTVWPVEAGWESHLASVCLILGSMGAP